MFTTDEQASASTTGMIVAVALMVVMSGVVYAGLSTRMDEQTDAETNIERASVDVVSQNQLRVVPVIGSDLDLDATTVRVTFPNSDKRGFTVTDAGAAIKRSETTTETTTRTVTNGLEPEPVYETVTRPVYDTVRKRVQTGTEPVEQTLPTYRWNRTVATDRAIHRWNRTVTEQVPQYRWHHTWTERVPRYRWERTTTDRDTTVDWESPGPAWSRASGVLHTDSVYKGQTRERVRTGTETERRLVDMERERVHVGYETREECSPSPWGFARGRTCETVREPVYEYERVPVYETVRQPTYEWQWRADYDTEAFYRYERVDRTTEQTLSTSEPTGDGWQKASSRAFDYTTVERTDSEVATDPPAPGWTRKSAAVVSRVDRTRTETTLAAEAPGDEWQRVSDAPVRVESVEQTQTKLAPRQPGEEWSLASDEAVGETTVTVQRPTYGVVEQRIRTGTTTERLISHYRMVPKTTVVTETETTATFDDSVDAVERGLTSAPARGPPDQASIAAADPDDDEASDDADSEASGERETETAEADETTDDGPPAHVLDRLPFLEFDDGDDSPVRASSIVEGLSGTTTRGSPAVWQNGEALTVHLAENHIQEGDIVRVRVVDTDTESVVLDKQVRARDLPAVSLDSAGPTDESSPGTDAPTAPEPVTTPDPTTTAGTPATQQTQPPQSTHPSAGDTWSGSATDTDRPPAVSISGPNTVAPGSKATFEANAVDDEGIADYSWHGAYSYDQSTATHTFADAPGETRRISLTVTDTAGQTATATKVVEISDANRDPQIELPPAVTGCVGETVRLNPTIVTEEGDTATGEWDRQMPIRLDSPGVSSATYTATDNHGAETYRSVRITTMSCTDSKQTTDEVGDGEGNEVLILSGSGEITATAGADDDKISVRDDTPSLENAQLNYAVSGVLAMGDRVADIATGSDSYVLETQVSGATAKQLVAEAKAARNPSLKEGSNIALNKHKTLRNPRIEDGLSPGNHDQVTVFVRVGSDEEINGTAMAARYGENPNTSEPSGVGEGTATPADDTNPTVDAADGITEAVTTDQADNRVIEAAGGRVSAVQNDQISDTDSLVSETTAQSDESTQQDSGTNDTQPSQSVQNRRNDVLQNSPLATYHGATTDDTVSEG
ncbi:PKD domain-containing protein [Halosegnis longus]|uniref:PKD/Chitinase domain-containing protein n=1 Tax=Halosegnis longus TaxID=2216012 RepID=A0AAJ4R7L2_9EURY|nr:PKD domain-containing protein [Halosegnis longus]RNJ25616.1 hypothetical protein Nmn1133_02230 [Salella cibi]